ncbi:MAG TPA: tetratricopeptide repeat protein [Vicinamibacterales bacterium]|nr:tetratricopeptide repeat protein [Vicinamibacterales bacterium]
MTKTSFRPIAAAVLTAVTLLAPRPAAAANKEHQQLMADLRILQEQSQQLQNMLGTLADAIKAVNTRLDQQAEADRRANADAKLLIDTLTKDLNVVREKVDDSNVRVGSLSQEIDALRQLVQQVLARQSVAGTEVPSQTPPVAGTPGAPATPPPPAATGASPTKTYEQAYGDYALGLYDLAIDGFEAFLKDSPRATQAPEAQFYIGSAYLNDGKYDKAVEAFDTLIRTYASSPRVADAYYRKGVALRSLKQPDRAREAWEFVTKNFPDTPAASLAKQALGQP